jgi:hypothetical protein
MVDGVRTVIASGDCLAILPETAESVPWRSEVSKRPAWVVVSNAKRSMASRLSGPTERRLSSWKVMPAAPSRPVTTTSPSCSGRPMVAGRLRPARSMPTLPLTTLTRPTSAAAASAAVTSRATAASTPNP